MLASLRLVPVHHRPHLPAVLIGQQREAGFHHRTSFLWRRRLGPEEQLLQRRELLLPHERGRQPRARAIPIRLIPLPRARRRELVPQFPRRRLPELLAAQT